MSQDIGRFAPDEAMRRFVAALTERHDPLRPLGRYVVTDNSQWSAVGASYVAVNVQGARKLAIYRDGPRPAVGSFLQCVRTGPEATAPWLALPQAVARPTRIVSVMYDTSATTYLGNFNSRLNADAAFIVAAYDTATARWTKLSNHPLTDTAWRGYNTGARDSGIMPLRAAGGNLFTYAVHWYSPWTTTITTTYPNAFVSTDGGATWVRVTALAGVRAIEHGAGGRLFALCDNGETIRVSTDNGATWAVWWSGLFALSYTVPFNGGAASSGTGNVFNIAPDPLDPARLTAEVYPSNGNVAPAFYSTYDGGATWSAGLAPVADAADSAPLTMTRVPWGGALAANLRATIRLQADPFPAQNTAHTVELAQPTLPFAFAGSRTDTAAYTWAGADGYLYYGARDSTAGTVSALGLIRTADGATWEHVVTGAETWIPTSTEGGVASKRVGVGSSLAVGTDLYVGIATAAMYSQWRGDAADYDALTVTTRGPRLMKRDGAGVWTDASGDYLTALTAPDDGLGAPWAYAIMPGGLVVSH